MGVHSVAEYVESLNTDGKLYVNQFISFMETHFPDYKVKISFSMPMWLAGDKMKDGYIAVSAAKSHVSVHFSDEDYVRNLASCCPSCKTGKRCINIKYHDDASFQFVLGKCQEFFETLSGGK